MSTLSGTMQRLPASASGTRTASPARTRERQVASGRGLRGDRDAAPVELASDHLAESYALPAIGQAVMAREDAVPERRARLGCVGVEGGDAVPWLW